MATPLWGNGKGTVHWLSDIEEARKRAKTERKLILLDFFSPT